MLLLAPCVEHFRYAVPRHVSDGLRAMVTAAMVALCAGGVLQLVRLDDAARPLACPAVSGMGESLDGLWRHQPELFVLVLQLWVALSVAHAKIQWRHAPPRAVGPQPEYGEQDVSRLT